MPRFRRRVKVYLVGTVAFFLLLAVGIPLLVMYTPWIKATKEPIVRLQLESSTTLELGMEEYLIGVLAGEISPLSPPEALKAMAVAARTFAWQRMERGEPLCVTVHCQVWLSPEERAQRWGPLKTPLYTWRIRQAIQETKGELLFYRGKAIQAQYHASCGTGRTESAKEVWGRDIPYLQSVACIEGTTQPSPREARFSPGELDKRLGSSVAAMAPQARSKALQVVEKTPSGRAKTVKVGQVEVEGTQFRTALGLPSTNIQLSWRGNELLVQTRGHGHAVGLCQTGTKLMAESGSSYDQILYHYYPGTYIRAAYSV